ncbi:MAG: calcium-binding protein [Nocardioides sp.]
MGTSASEVIHGTPGRDVINGLGGNDTIYGGGGDDLVCGGSGADRLYGGAGDDRLYGERDRLHSAQEDGTERVGDTLRGGPGADHLDGGMDRRPADLVVPDVYSWDGSAHGVHIDLRRGTARGEGVDSLAGRTFTVVGSAHGDVVVGTNRRDRIYTGAGPDVVRARGGNDYIQVDPMSGGPRGAGGDADRVWAGRGRDHIVSMRGQDHLSGGKGNDLIEAGNGGNDVILGGAGDDHIWAEIADTSGPQVWKGGRGTDTVQVNSDRINRSGAASTGVWNMSTGAMTFTLGHPISLVVPIHRAVLATSGTAWTVTGGPGDDVLSGDPDSTSPVTFDGLAGDDTFRGTDGDDVFDGGPGTDHSLGMLGGDDTCISVEIIDGSDCEHVS